MSEPKQSNRVTPLSAFLSLGAAILFWSLNPLMLKYFTRDLDAWTVNGMRYLFAILFWLPWLIGTRQKKPAGRNIWKDAARPAAVHTVGQVLFALTPYFNDATIINFVSRISLAFSISFGFALLPEERPLARSALFWSGFVAAAAGVAVMYWGGLSSTTTSALGMTILIAAFACWGLYAVLIRKHMHGYSVRQSYATISLIAGPVIIALMFFMGDWSRIFQLSAVQWALLWFSAITGLALGHVLFFHAIHNLGPITSEGSLTLMPFITAMLASWILGEHMDRMQWAGGLLLVLGSALLLFGKLATQRAGQIHEDDILPATGR